MNVKEYKKQFSEGDAIGWHAIDEQLQKVYANKEPRHYAPVLSYRLGGTEHLDGVSIYDNSLQIDHFHLVSYGMSELYYNEDACKNSFSNWGFEFTFRCLPFKDDSGDPTWMNEVFNNLARYVFETGRWFEENQFIPANGPIRLNTETEIVGFVFTQDTQLGKINTVHGELTFIQLVGITTAELKKLQENPKTSEVEKLIEKLKKDNPLLITDLNRK